MLVNAVRSMQIKQLSVNLHNFIAQPSRTCSIFKIINKNLINVK